MKHALAAVLLAFLATTPAAADSGLITKPSQHPVAETIDRLEAILKSEKFQVFARVDFQALASASNVKIRPNQILIFGRGGALPLLSVKPVAAVDLPFKALAWEDESGKVWLSYNSSEYLKERHGIAGQDDLIKRISGLLDKFSNMAAE